MKGGVHGKGGHVWQRGKCMAKGGHVWQGRGACMVKGGVRGIRRDTINKRAVRILLECILVNKIFVFF